MTPLLFIGLGSLYQGLELELSAFVIFCATSDDICLRNSFDILRYFLDLITLGLICSNLITENRILIWKYQIVYGSIPFNVAPVPLGLGLESKQVLLVAVYILFESINSFVICSQLLYVIIFVFNNIIILTAIIRSFFLKHETQIDLGLRALQGVGAE